MISFYYLKYKVHLAFPDVPDFHPEQFEQKSGHPEYAENVEDFFLWRNDLARNVIST